MTSGDKSIQSAEGEGGGGYTPPFFTLPFEFLDVFASGILLVHLVLGSFSSVSQFPWMLLSGLVSSVGQRKKAKSNQNIDEDCLFEKTSTSYPMTKGQTLITP